MSEITTVPRSSRPNIVIFMPDQLRADALSAFGNPVARTPHFDEFASRATLFTDAHCQHTVCSPSRASLLTGWYPHTQGHRTLTNLLKPWEPNLLRTFRQAGYTVAWTGQRGDALAPGVTAESCDFYGNLVTAMAPEHTMPYPPGHKFYDAFYSGRIESDAPLLDADEAEIQTVERWLADAPPEPWLLYVTPISPHCPFRVEEPWFSLHDRAQMPLPVDADLADKPRFMRGLRERYGTDRLTDDDWREIIATYYGMVSRTDSHFGRVMQAVERAGAADNTVTVVTTDHGEYLGDYGLVEKFPSGLNDCLTRNPLMIAGPGLHAGARSDAMVELVDVLPTLLELADIDPSHTHFGRSLVPILAGTSTAHRQAAFSEGGFSRNERNLLEPIGYPFYRNKVLQQHEDPDSVGRAIACRATDFTYVYRLYESDELYDRRADPHETINIAARTEHANTVTAMRERVLAWLAETSDVIGWELDPRKDPAVRANPFLAGC